MFDNNYDTQEGVSIWDHILDGAATGGGVGALFGGIGAIPGALLGGGIGLVNGLIEDHEQSTAYDQWKNDMDHASGAKQRGLESSMNSKADAILADPEQMKRYTNDGKVDSEAIVQKAMDRTFYADYAKTKESQSSFFGDLF